jgi:Fe2+ or Zn2+ uptake regulation protein
MEREQSILAILKDHKLRLTKTRRATVALFLREHTPLSVPQILDALSAQMIHVNKTTVYRELETLEKLGIVKSVKLEDRRQYFELATRDHHHHFVCVACEEIEDVLLDECDLERQEGILARKNGFSVFRHSLEFFGLCKLCR